MRVQVCSGKDPLDHKTLEFRALAIEHYCPTKDKYQQHFDNDYGLGNTIWKPLIFVAGFTFKSMNISWVFAVAFQIDSVVYSCSSSSFLSNLYCFEDYLL